MIERSAAGFGCWRFDAVAASWYSGPPRSTVNRRGTWYAKKQRWYKLNNWTNWFIDFALLTISSTINPFDSLVHICLLFWSWTSIDGEGCPHDVRIMWTSSILHPCGKNHRLPPPPLSSACTRGKIYTYIMHPLAFGGHQTGQHGRRSRYIRRFMRGEMSQKSNAKWTN